MRWPTQAVESVRPSRFWPPFCPWPTCSEHRARRGRFHRHGTYNRPGDSRKIPRYRCLACQRTCSRQTFSCTYYLKRPELLAEVAAGLVACSAHRQIARSRGAAKTSVTRLANRLGRHALLLHVRALADLSEIHEPVVHDHFEVFIGRQDRALGIGTAVGAKSWFCYGPDPAPHRGSGRRPDRQAAASQGLAHQAYVRSITRTLDLLAPLIPLGATLQLIADGRQDYRRALERHPSRQRFRLRAYRNPDRRRKGSPPDPQARLRDAALFPVDQLHQLLRHSCADHKRETIAFGRRLEAILGRAFLVTVWKNFVKGRSERRADRTTPAMRQRLAHTPWTWPRVLAQRLFPSRHVLPELWQQLYRYASTTGQPLFTAKHTF